MGLSEEAGKAATGVIDALRSQPLALALIVINVCFLLFVGWVMHEIATGRKIEREQRAQMFTTLLQQCGVQKP